MWTAEITEVLKNPDGLTLTVTYKVTDGKSDEFTTEPFVSRSGKIDIWRIAQDKADFKNRVDLQRAEIAALDPATIVGPVDLTPLPPTPPDPAFLDFQTHLTILQEEMAYVTIQKKLPQNVDLLTAQGTIKSDLAIQPEWIRFIVGL